MSLPDLPRGAGRLVIIAIAGIVLVALARWWFTEPAVTVPVQVVPAPTATSGSSAYLWVDVVGAVRRPGVVRLPAGSRVFAAVEAAGGLAPGARAGINLARTVVDGEQIVVGVQPVLAQANGAAPRASEGGAVDINAADAAALEALDGIGPVLAGRIVEFRERNGPFKTIRDLLDVPGVGDATFAALADQVRV